MHLLLVNAERAGRLGIHLHSEKRQNYDMKSNTMSTSLRNHISQGLSCKMKSRLFHSVWVLLTVSPSTRPRMALSDIMSRCVKKITLQFPLLLELLQPVLWRRISDDQRLYTGEEKGSRSQQGRRCNEFKNINDSACSI